MSISDFLQNLQPLSKDPHWEEQLGEIWASLFYESLGQHGDQTSQS